MLNSDCYRYSDSTAGYKLFKDLYYCDRASPIRLKSHRMYSDRKKATIDHVFVLQQSLFRLT